MSSTTDAVAIVWDQSTQALYKSAMYGQLKSVATSDTVAVTLVNNLRCPVNIFLEDELGSESWWFGLALGDPSQSSQTDNCYQGDLYANTYFVVRTGGTGSC